MVTNVYMFSTRMIITIFGKRDCRLVVVEEYDWVAEWFEDFTNETAEPRASLAAWVDATYSAFVVDSVMSSCFRELQDIAPPSIRNAYPVITCRCSWDAPSASA
jgi:hypothetical protein